ncbi:hypothetical protein GWK36_02720 [Caldichromatium japonicum]|uniref:Uncharacterized protein n=1 Tax=Caldichromatium japonicum TaxID=2699430 RepID=A0A6G7VAU4_9GAMM|nr:hypothetical protein [Caldichromatium japonicum]QIK37094.1 hypothetical protein GWK36_02720 [Caldichromatium japonicum]
MQSSTAAHWGARLSDGARIEVESGTHRAWRLEAGQRAPLWDGVHRLEDGSVVIVRDGVAVPTEPMLRAWESPPPRQEETDERTLGPCSALIERVCGADGRCGETEPCRLARELLQIGRETLPAELKQPLSPSVGSQCSEALGNPFFIPCR